MPPFRVQIAALLAAILLSGPALAQSIDDRADLSALFKKQGTPGTFVLFDIAAERIAVVDRDRAEQRFVPASTFKIANSLIALETGVVKDETEVIPYGGQPQPVKAWEKDMDLREAVRVSNVAVFQELARRIGVERMQEGIDRLRYGNGQLGDVVDRFWLDGPLEISAMEQARFTAALAEKRLAVSARSQEIVRGLLKLEQHGDAVLYGKTGWYVGQKPDIGWLVGWVERGGRATAYALNIDMPRKGDEAKRLPLAKALLSALGAY